MRVMELARRPRPCAEADVVAAIAQRRGTPDLVERMVAAGAVDGAIVMHEHVARLDVEMHDVVVVEMSFDVREELAFGAWERGLRDEDVRLIQLAVPVRAAPVL